MSVRKWLLAGLVLLCGFSLLACNESTTTTDGVDYEDFDFIESFAEIWTRRDAGGDYIIYMYTTSCSSCEDIKDDLFEFAQTYAGKHVYFFDITDYSKSDAEVTEYFVGPTGITELYYPVLLLVEDQSFDKTQTNRYFYSGKTRILPILYDLEQGAFTFGD